MTAYFTHRFSYDGWCVCGYHMEDFHSGVSPCPHHAPALVVDTDALERVHHREATRKKYVERYGYNVEIVRQQELVDEEIPGLGWGRTWYSTVIYRYANEYQSVQTHLLHDDVHTIEWQEWPGGDWFITVVIVSPVETEPGFSGATRVVNGVLLGKDDLVRHGCPLRELDGVTPVVEFER